MLFSETLATLKPDARGITFEVAEVWTQGRAVFGGLVAALGNEAMRQLVPQDRPLRGLETAFVGPLFPGTVRVEAQILREGKSVTAAAARVYNGETLAACLTGIYGASRQTEISVVPQPPAGVPPAAALRTVDAGAPGLPRFLKYFGLRFAEGAAPYAGSSLTHAKTYIRHEDAGPLTESHVVALIDCIPPPVLQMMTRVAPASSLTWTLDFIRHDYRFDPQAWWRIDTEIKGAGDGYSQEQSLVLDPNGVPVAFSRQLVAVFG